MMASCFSVEEVIIKILQLDCNPFYNTCMHKKELFRDVHVSSLTAKKSKKYHNYFFFIKGILRKERAIFITQVLKSIKVLKLSMTKRYVPSLQKKIC